MSEAPEPLDLRLVPAALAAWLAAVVGTRLLPAPADGVLALLLALAGAVASRRGPWRPGVVAPGPGHAPAARSRDPQQRGGRGAPPRAVAGRTAAGATALALWSAAAVLTVAAAVAHVRDVDPVVAAAQDEAVVTVVGTVLVPPVAAAAPWEHGDPGRVVTSLAVRTVTTRGDVLASRVSLEVEGGRGWADVVPGQVVAATGRLRATLDRQAPAALTAAEPVPLRAAGGLQRGAALVRAGLLRATDGLSGDARALLPGLAVGDTGRVSADLDDAMRVSGLAHLTAVSGGHVAVVATTVLALAGALRAPRWARIGLLVGAVAGFLLVAQPGASVARAAVMGAVSVVGMALGRRSRPVAALSAAVVVLLVSDPWWATSFGFVLSVVATAAIAVVAVPAAHALGRGRARSLLAAVLVPLAAQSACGPVLVLLEPAVGPWAVVANVAAAPAVLPATVGGLTAAVLAPAWPAGAAAVARVAGLPAAWLGGVARTVATLPGSSIGWASGAPGFLALACLTAAGWLAGAGVLRAWRSRDGA